MRSLYWTFNFARGNLFGIGLHIVAMAHRFAM